MAESMKSKLSVFMVSAILLLTFVQVDAQKYESNWRSVRQINTPQWLQDGKFGIYTHWGPYAVHAFGSNTTWYSYSLYQTKHDGPREHFEKTFGKLTKDFGYKDLIPMFTGEKFDAEEWADLFQKAGAKFAGPVAEHHDGFAMWDTKYSEWNAAKMGPQRDVVGELAEAIKKREMKFVTAFHHAANWFFFPVWDDRYDTGDPKNSGLYGQYHEEGAMRNKEFNDEWYNKIIEVIDNYGPDFIWFDFALDAMPEGYILDFLAYYYNWAERNGKEVVVTYKHHDLIPDAGLRDLELGQEPEITYHDWITDSSIDDRGAWGWADDLTFKTPNMLIDNLIDRVSKNGYLLLNIGPKPDGTIPEGAKEVLLEMGAWLETNGDAIYNTTPWFIAGEGPTKIAEIELKRQGFNESGTVYTPEDIRFTVNGTDLYATFLDWPGDKAIIKTLRATGPDKDKIIIPEWAKLKEVKSIAGIGKELKIVDVGQPHHPGFYKQEIKRITMLGDDKELEWVMTGRGLIIKTPEKQGKYAYSFKIERHHHPRID
jgi:alpha-L-fucosidase